MKIKSAHAKDEPEGMPDLVVLLKYEMSSCAREELVGICQELIDSGRLNDFMHPLRRTCYDLALGGFVNDLQVPPNYLEMTMDPDRVTELAVSIH